MSVPSHEEAGGATGVRAAILEQVRPQRRQLIRRLRPYLSPVVSTDDPAELIEIVARERLPLVVVELALPGVDTLAVLRDLRERFENLNLAAVVTFAPEQMTEAAMAAGADVCISEHAPDHDLKEALEFLASPVRHHNGASDRPPPRRQTLLTDLQAQLAQAHEAHASSMRADRALLDLLGEGVYIVDEDGWILQANSAACEILGLSVDQIVGRSVLDAGWAIVADDGTAMTVDERPIVLALREGIAQHGAPLGIGRPDGTVRWLLVNSEPILDPGERKAHAVVVSFQDVTAQRTATAALAAREAMSRSIFEGAAAPIAIASAFDDVIIDVNRAYEDLTGYPRHELIGMRLSDITHPDDRAMDIAIRRDLLARRTPVLRWDKRYVRRDRRVINVRVAASIVDDPRDGGPIQVVVFSDVTDLER